MTRDAVGRVRGKIELTSAGGERPEDAARTPGDTLDRPCEFWSSGTSEGMRVDALGGLWYSVDRIRKFVTCFKAQRVDISVRITGNVHSMY